MLPTDAVPEIVAAASTDGAAPAICEVDVEYCVAVGATPLDAVTPTITYFVMSLALKLYEADVAALVDVAPEIAEQVELRVADAEPTAAVQLYHWYV